MKTQKRFPSWWSYLCPVAVGAARGENQNPSVPSNEGLRIHKVVALSVSYESHILVPLLLVAPGEDSDP